MQKQNEKNLTQLEIPRLSETFNLTDGHVHRRWDKKEKAIINKTAFFFRTVSREMQPKLEKEFKTSFYELSKQTVNDKKINYLLCTSASMSLEIIANYLRLNKASLALIEPCFDNLADIFKRHNIKLEVIPEKYLIDSDLDNFLKSIKSSAICLVSPNNPTGLAYSKENLEKFAKYCKYNNKFLIIDSSFRFYNDRENIFDEYALLNKIGVSYVFIEDTGKTWPTHDIKISILAISKKLFNDIYDIYTDFILHASPFVIKLLTEFISNSKNDNLQKVYEVIEINRKFLYKNIKDTFLTPTEKSYASVAWLKIRNQLKAIEFKKILDKNGVYVLPGNYFFWSNKDNCDKFIRIALSRDTEKFKRAIEKLRIVCRKIK